MKKALLIVLAVLIILGMTSWLTTKQRLIIYKDPDRHIEARIPFSSIGGILLDYTCKITFSTDDNAPFLLLLFNAFERPRFFWFSKDTGILFVIYRRDTERLLFAIEPKDSMVQSSHSSVPPQPEYPKNWSLERVVKAHSDTVTVRYMTIQEIESLASKVKELSGATYQALSVPTLDTGFWKYYVSQEEMISLLKWEAENRKEQKG